MRLLPCELRVRAGQTVILIARHTDRYLATLELAGLTEEMLVDGKLPATSPFHRNVGHHELVGRPHAQGLSVFLHKPGTLFTGGV